MSPFAPRPGQAQVLAFTRGKMGVSAAPGSGKTQTLAHLAAKLVVDGIVEGQEVLVVTLVNSAVENLKRRINQAIREQGERLLPGLGFRVRTLHGLAHDIVRERPGLVGLAEDFGIIDDFEADSIRRDAVEAWLRAHADSSEPYLAYSLESHQMEAVKRREWPSLIGTLSSACMRRAKDLQLTPDLLLARLEPYRALALAGSPFPLGLALLSAEIYADYQRSLSYRGVVDFDDLVRLALDALVGQPEYLARLQSRWPYILEDEAQDSSRVQESILRLLAGSQGNWVRVGDTNQAIYETFTTANPRLLRGFLRETDVDAIQLEHSGRSQQAIIDLANFLVNWALDEHPEPAVRAPHGSDESGEEADGAFLRLQIKPTLPGDPQQNPSADLSAVHLVRQAFTPQEELEAVAKSLRHWFRQQTGLPAQERTTCAVLAPRTEHGARLADLLKRHDIPFVELLRTSSSTRQTVGLVRDVLSCLADPTSSRKLSGAFRAWAHTLRNKTNSLPLVDGISRRLLGCAAVEAYLWPRAEHDWLEQSEPQPSTDELALLWEFREAACRWHRAAALPIDQLILTIANELFREPTELALTHKLAVVLGDVAEAHRTYRLPELVEELKTIVQNERRFLGFGSEEMGFEPPHGTVTLSTMHKAKGLEWDRVYLTSVNEFDFPSGLATDTYQDERWFVRDSLNLQAEALAQLEALAEPGAGITGRGAMIPEEGVATQQARLAYIAERLRLLYVGITRAKRELFITWNSGRRPGKRQQAALALVALWDEWGRRAAQEKANE